MTKQIPPNGCLFCELPKPIHWSRLDGLHPPGVWTWVEPSDRVRLQRMKRNRAIREASTMNMIGNPLSMLPPSEWVGKWVTYNGKRREYVFGDGRVFKIVEKRDDNKAAGMDTDFGIEWCAPGSLLLADDPNPAVAEVMTVERAEEVLNPHSVSISILDVEISRLESRIAELKIARRVLSEQ